MKTVKQQYAELLALTRQYLLQHHSPKERLFADGETYAYFREIALEKMANAKKAPPQKTSQSSAPSFAPVSPQQINQPTLSPTIPSPKTKPAQLNQAPYPDSQTPQECTEIQNNADIPIISENPPVQNDGPTRAPPVKPTETPLVKEDSNKDTKSALILMLSPPPHVEQENFSDLRTIIEERQPTLKLLNSIPSDAEAKKMARLWEQEVITEILILNFSGGLKNDAFLENLRVAMENFGNSTQVIQGNRFENGTGWETLLSSPHLRLVIAQSSDLDHAKKLKKHLKESTQHASKFLNKIPLYLLADPATYMQEPTLKPKLWRSLKEILAKKI